MPVSRINPSSWMYTDGNGKVQSDDVVKAAGGWYKVHPNGYRELIHCLKDIGNPAPVIISLLNPPDDSYYETDSMTLEIEFSEIVNVVTTGGTPYVYLTDPVSGATVKLAYASGTGTDTLTFTGAMTDIVAESLVFYPEIQLNGGTILDASLNPIDNDFPATYEQPVIIANTELIFSVDNPTDGYYTVSDNLTFTVTYSGAVTVSGTDTVYVRLIDSEDTEIDIALTSGDGTTDLVFTGPATGAANGALTVYPALILGDATTLVDVNTNDVSVAFPATYEQPVIIANTEVIFDVLNPADGEYEATDPLTFTVTYSGAVTVSGTDTVYLRVTDFEDNDIDIALTSGDGTTDLVFTGPATGAANGALTVYPALILGTDTLLVDAHTNEATVDFPAGYVAPEIEIITLTP